MPCEFASLPKILNRCVHDGFYDRTAYRSGVTLATSSLARPVYLGGSGSQVISGLSTTFRTGSAHAMERGAIIQEIAALHVTLGRAHPLSDVGVSVSTQISGLRRLLSGWESTDKETGFWFRKAAEVCHLIRNHSIFHLKFMVGCGTPGYRRRERRYHGHAANFEGGSGG
jgi:hypothetical protein